MFEIRRRHLGLFILLLLSVWLIAAPAGANPNYLPADDTADGRIVGGSVVDPPGNYPFQVALVAKGYNAYAGQFCGGSLIGPEWVLTASHCVDGESASGIFIVIGRHDLKKNNGHVIDVDAIYMHPDYNRRTLDNDIAVLKLAEPASYAAVNLPADDTLATPGTELTVTGWGSTQAVAADGGGGFTFNDPVARFSGGPSKLREVDVDVKGNCKKTYGSEYIEDSMFCAGGSGVDSCQGDSGGPIFAMVANEYTQAGIVSWGYGCAAPGVPGVYTRLSAYVPWVTQITGIGPGGDDLPKCKGKTATHVGTDGDDTINGTAGDDVIVGLKGDDVLNGKGGNDTICANQGDDVVRGGPGADLILGGSGADELRGTGGNDVIRGNGQADTMFGGAGADTLVGGKGTDIAKGGNGADTCTAETMVSC